MPMPRMTDRGTGRHHTVSLCTGDPSTTASYRLASPWNRLLTISPPAKGMCVCVCDFQFLLVKHAGLLWMHRVA